MMKNGNYAPIFLPYSYSCLISSVLIHHFINVNLSRKVSSLIEWISNHATTKFVVPASLDVKKIDDKLQSEYELSRFGMVDDDEEDEDCGECSL